MRYVFLSTSDHPEWGGGNIDLRYTRLEDAAQF